MGALTTQEHSNASPPWFGRHSRGVEIIRRSTVMLSPGQNAALDGETRWRSWVSWAGLSAKDRQVRDVRARLPAILDAD